jgi:hypothetical protein
MEDPVRSFPQPGTPDLKAAVRRARLEDAERSSVSAELRGAELARLEMLDEVLQPVFAQLPREADLFDQGLVPGEKPRLFVDMVAFVEMARDRRTFRFLQDTRSGRVLLAESEKVDAVAEAVTAYLGRRLVEREKALASTEAEVLPVLAAPQAPVAEEAVRDDAPAGLSAERYRFADMLFAFVMGAISGATLFFTYGWLRANGTLPPFP